MSFIPPPFFWLSSSALSLSRLKTSQSSMSVEALPNVSQEDFQVARYRPAAQIPDHVREHCHIYLDEQLYTSALTLLSDLVTSGASHVDRESKTVIAPAPFHIEIISCLLVHPRYTTQAPPNERSDLIPRSINLLRNILAILGPVNARFDEVFSFSSADSRSSRRARPKVEIEDAASGSESDDGVERMKGVLANSGRLRRCAKDFWHVVGWVMNCCVKYPQRWNYWKVWLVFMLDLLEADWVERERLDTEEPNWQVQQEADVSAVCEFNNLRNCLLLQYLSDVKDGAKHPLKRIVRSIFADGSAESLKEFPEVFPNETSDNRPKGYKRKRGSRFGDYNDEDEIAAYESSEFINQLSDSPDQDEHSADAHNQHSTEEVESIHMKQKLITLISRAAHYFSEEFIGVYDLYDVINTSLYQLPLPAFSLFTSPSHNPHFPSEVYVSLFQIFLDRLLPSTAPRPNKVNGEQHDDISQMGLQQCFLPHAAMTSSIQDNARLSMLVEHFLRLFLKHCDWEYSEVFGQAIETGVLARQQKAKVDRRRKETSARGKAEDTDLAWLKASGERLMMLKAFMEQVGSNA